MPRMSLMSSDATTAPAEKGNGYNPIQLGLVIVLVISSTKFSLGNIYIFWEQNGGIKTPQKQMYNGLLGTS